MVTINMIYEGDLRFNTTHGPSGTDLKTDAPADNQGKGESFSPTDLVATALGSCMGTIMGIVAKKDNIDLIGMTIKVEKKMTSKPPRKIEELKVDIKVLKPVKEEYRKKLENAAKTCPVYYSINPDIKTDIKFSWG